MAASQEAFLVEAFSPVYVGLGIGKFFRAEREVFLIHVAKGDDVFAGDGVEVGFTPAPRAEQRDVEFVAWRVSSKEFDARKNERSGAGNGGGLEELASFHGSDGCATN